MDIACCTGVARVITIHNTQYCGYYMSGVHHLSAGQAAAVLTDSGTISRIDEIKAAAITLAWS